jgi:signal peptidase I
MSEEHLEQPPATAASADSPAPSDALASAEQASEGSSASPRWRRRSRILWREWIKPLLIIGFVMFSFRSAVADWNDVPTGSMKPTILEGDRIFINKLAYDLKFPFTRWRLANWKDPEWGDVVVLLSPEDGKRLVKRVVGLPGDVIEFHNDMYLWRNGEPVKLSEPDWPIPDGSLDQEYPSARVLNEHAEGRDHPVMLHIGGRLRPGELPPPGCRGDDEVDQQTARRQRWRRNTWVCRLGDNEFFVMGDNRNNSRDSRYFGPVDRSLILGQATAVALSFDRNNYFKPRLERFFSDLP